MIKRRLPKGRFSIPDPRKTYNKDGKDGKDDVVKYIEEFDKLNALKRGGTVVRGKRI